MNWTSALYGALPLVQWTLTLTLFFVSGQSHAIEDFHSTVLIPSLAGLAWCFNLWVLPIIRLNGSISAPAQMEEMARRGGIWLEPGNACIAALLAVVAVFTSQHSDPMEAATWRYYAAASFTLLQVAWWERVTIFGLDDEIVALKGERRDCKGSESIQMDRERQAKLWRIMDRWTVRHAVRAGLPVVAAFLAVTPKVLGTVSWTASVV